MMECIGVGFVVILDCFFDVLELPTCLMMFGRIMICFRGSSMDFWWDDGIRAGNDISNEVELVG